MQIAPLIDLSQFQTLARAIVVGLLVVAVACLWLVLRDRQTWM